jgi:hypothetical protein
MQDIFFLKNPYFRVLFLTRIVLKISIYLNLNHINSNKILFLVILNFYQARLKYNKPFPNKNSINNLYYLIFRLPQSLKVFQ